MPSVVPVSRIFVVWSRTQSLGLNSTDIDETNREGWSVLVQGPAHHVPPEEAAGVAGAGVTPWAGGERQLYIRIVPQHITGRRIHGS